jgi:hypothetical protein
LIVTCGAGVGEGAGAAGPTGTETAAGSAVSSEPDPLQPTTAIAPHSRTNSITLARMDATFVTGYLLNMSYRSSSSTTSVTLDMMLVVVARGGGLRSVIALHLDLAG